MSVPAIITEMSITVMIDSETIPITDSHVNYDRIREALKAGGDEATIRSLLDISASITEFGEGRVTVEGGVVKYDGETVHNALTVRMISMMRDGFNITPMVRFMENLMENPSYRAVNQLYGFLETCDLPITPDGHFIAYKMVRDDYMDNHTGTMDNSVGATPSMPRNQVNENPEETCSRGLHFCSQGYLGFYGSGRTMMVKINPRDVVSIPVDYNNAKGRACCYTIVSELEQKYESGDEVSYGSSVAVEYGDEYEDEATTDAYGTYADEYDDEADAELVSAGPLDEYDETDGALTSAEAEADDRMNTGWTFFTDRDDAAAHLDVTRESLRKRLKRKTTAKEGKRGGVWGFWAMD